MITDEPTPRYAAVRTNGQFSCYHLFSLYTA